MARMNLVLKSPNEAPGEKGKDIHVLILGENSVLTQHASTLLGTIGRHNELEGRMICSWWNFEVLGITALRKLAATEAAAADMIVIAAREAPELSPVVVDWVSQWLALRECHPQALVALLDSSKAGQPATRGVQAQLEKTAVLGGLDFFAAEAGGRLDEGETRRVSEATRELVQAYEPIPLLSCPSLRRGRSAACGA
jgi:hypothetical protein